MSLSFLSLMSDIASLPTLASDDEVMVVTSAGPKKIKYSDFLSMLSAALPSGGGGSASPTTLTVNGSLTGSVYTGDSITGSYAAVNGTAPYLFYTNDTLPPGMTLNSDGTRSGSYLDVGNFTFVVNVLDANGVRGYLTEVVSITSLLTLSGAAGNFDNHTVLSGSYSATGGTAPYTYSTSGTLPPGMAVGSDGTRTGQLTTAGTYSFDIIATDANGHTGKLVESITVNPIVLTVAGNVGTLVNGDAVTGAYTVTGNGTAPYTFSATGLPTGMTLAANGTWGGNVTANGSFAAQITVTDANGETTTYTDNIVVGVMTVTNTAADATTNLAYAGTLDIGGVYVAPLTVDLTGAPSWLAAAINGAQVQFSGTPTATGSTGNFTVTVHDSDGQSIPVTVAINVVAPTIAVSGNIGTVNNGDAFTGAYTATGGTGPYTFSTSGTLPPGLVVASDGTRSGTATTNGTYNFTVTATDANSITGSISEAVTVQAKPYSAWNPAAANAEIVVSNGAGTNTVAGYSASGNNSAIVYNDTQITAKTYVEFILKSPASAIAGIGIGTGVIDWQYDHNKIGDPHQQAGIFVPTGQVNQTYFVYTVPLVNDGTAGEFRLGLAVDPATRNWWVTNDGTTWVKGADGTAGDPVNGTHSISPPDAGTVLYFGASPEDAANTVEIVSDPAAMSWNAPTGFTKGLPKA